jgi:hypothetical protein
VNALALIAAAVSNGKKMTFQIHRQALVKIPRQAMQPSSKVFTIRVTGQVLAEAIKAANGDPARLEIIDDHTIVVWNSREQRDAVRINRMAINSQYGKESGRARSTRSRVRSVR